MARQQSKSLTKKRDLQKFERRIELTYSQIDKNLSFVTSKAIHDYHNVMVREGMKNSTCSTHIKILYNLSKDLTCSKCKFKKKDWNVATKNDINLLLTHLMQTYSDDGKETEYTKDHKKILKIFFRWLVFGYRSQKDCIIEHGVGDPPETRHIKIKTPDSKLKASDLVSEQERLWMLEACDHPMDTYLIDIPFDGGFRAGEFFGITIGNIRQDKHGFIIDVDGKTGVRPVRMIRSTPSIANWYSQHPFKENPNSPMLISLSKSHYGEPLSYGSARKRIERICDKVRKKHPQFTKRIYLQLFRHTEATNSAKFMPDGITKKRHGWAKNSLMQNRYSHLVQSDVDDTIFNHYGIENDVEVPKMPQKCPICQVINSTNASICSNCGKPLSIEAAEELEENERKKNTDLAKEFDDFKLQHQKDMASILSMLPDKKL